MSHGGIVAAYRPKIMLPSLLAGLVAYWKLEEAAGARDDAHGANDLTDNNTVTQAAGKQGNCGQFTRANAEYLSIADNVALSMLSTSFTIVAWVRADSLNNWGHLVAKYNYGANDREYSVFTTATQLKFAVSSNGSGQTEVVYSGAFNLATWYFVVAWYDRVAGTINIQVNGGAVDSQAHAGGVRDGGSAFTIGGLGSAGDYFDGRVDEVAIWERVLTAGERAYLYNGGNGRTYPL